MKKVLFGLLAGALWVSPIRAQTSFDHNRTLASTALPAGVLSEGFPGAPVVVIPAAWLGLTSQDDVDALSFGDDQALTILHSIVFSPDVLTAGVLLSGVSTEVGADTPPGIPPAAAGDLFLQIPTPTGNTLAPPGLGYATGTRTGDEANAVWATPCLPGALCDDLDAFEFTSVTAALGGVYFSLRAGSPTLALIPAAPGDILYSDLTGSLPVVASLAGAGLATAANLGIQGLDLDGLALVGSVGPPGIGGIISAGLVGPSIAGNPFPASTHLLEFSVDPSAGIGADVLIRTGPGTFGVHTPAPLLGLLPQENVDALEVTPCSPFPASSTPYNGSGINLDVLSATNVVVGSTWVPTITPQAGRGPGSWVLFVRSAPTSGFVIDLGLFLFGVPGGVSELLVTGLQYTSVVAVHSGGGIPAPAPLAVPLNCNLLGLNWFAQAVVLGDLPAFPGTLDPWFSTAMSGIIGSF